MKGSKFLTICVCLLLSSVVYAIDAPDVAYLAALGTYNTSSYCPVCDNLEYYKYPDNTRTVAPGHCLITSCDCGTFTSATQACVDTSSSIWRTAIYQPAGDGADGLCDYCGASMNVCSSHSYLIPSKYTQYTSEQHMVETVCNRCGTMPVTTYAEKHTDTNFDGNCDKCQYVVSEVLSSCNEGDIIYLSENGTLMPFYVAKHNYESDRTLLVRKDAYDSRQWHSTNTNTYADSDIDAWLNTDYKSLLDPTIQSASNVTQFPYTPGGSDMTLSTLCRSVFLLSATEHGFTGINLNAEGSKLPIASTLKIAYLNGTAGYQWNRSPSTNSTDVYTVNDSGYPAVRGVTSTYYVRPCFTLADDVLINSDGTVTETDATISWVVDGVVTRVEQSIGATVSIPTTPTKVGYVFEGWKPSVSDTDVVTGSAVYTAEWSIDADDYGTTGDVMWLYKDGVLTIRGDGAMGDYVAATVPWKQYRPNIHTIIVEEGVTRLGDFVFSTCYVATSLTLPSTLVTIGEASVSGCDALKEVSIPSGVSSLGNNAFWNLATKSYIYTYTPEMFVQTKHYNSTRTTIVDLNGYTITWHLGDGTTTTTSIQFGDTVVLPIEPSNPPRVFDGWWTAEAGGTQIMSSTVYETVGNTEYYAQWIEYFSVTVPTSIHVAVTPDGECVCIPLTITNNSTCTVSITNIEINELNGWTLVPMSTQMSTTKVDSKYISLEFDTTLPWTIPNGIYQDYTYSVALSATSAPYVNEQVLTLILTVEEVV